VRKAGDAARLLRHVGPRLLVPLVGLELTNALMPLGIIAVIGVLVGRVAEGGAIAGPLAGLSVLLLLQQLVGPVRTAVAYRATRRVDGVVRGRVMAVGNRSLGTAPLEDPGVLDRLEPPAGRSTSTGTPRRAGRRWPWSRWAAATSRWPAPPGSWRGSSCSPAWPPRPRHAPGPSPRSCRTASRPCAWPTTSSSWPAGGSWSRAHESLMAAGGVYQELYDIQAQAYR
jgi:hypothetical protein